MIWHSDPDPLRNPQRGAIMIEALIAFALVTMVVGTVMVTLSSVTRQQADRIDRLMLTEFARSTLEEYALTYPVMQPNGEAVGGWSWRISEKPAKPNPPGVLDADVEYVSVTAHVWNASKPEISIETDTLVARRLQ